MCDECMLRQCRHRGCVCRASLPSEAARPPLCRQVAFREQGLPKSEATDACSPPQVPLSDKSLLPAGEEYVGGREGMGGLLLSSKVSHRNPTQYVRQLGCFK